MNKDTIIKNLFIATQKEFLEDRIDKMCATDDEQELERMYKWAQQGLEKIYRYNKKRLKDN